MACGDGLGRKSSCNIGLLTNALSKARFGALVRSCLIFGIACRSFVNIYR